jgi:hypothetical protein
MGRMYEMVQRIDSIIDRKGLDAFKTKGQISLECGFFVSLIGPDEPDDDQKIRTLADAAQRVLGEPIG